MIIGVDIDGTITDGSAIAQGVKEHLRLDHHVPYSMREKDMDITKEQWAEFYNTGIADAYMKEAVRPHVQSVLNSWYRAGDLVHLITTREHRHLDITRSWLISNGIFYTTINMTKNKGPSAIALNVDVMIEDSYENALSCAHCGVLTYLLSSPYNTGPEHALIVRVKDWTEISKEVNNLRRAQQDFMKDSQTWRFV